MALEFTSISVRGKTAEYLQYNTEGIPAHFYPANGFPVGTYSQFLKHISEKFQLNCLSLRPCWPGIGEPKGQTNWEMYADDLIAFLEQQYEQPVVGIGHSQGATATLIAAAKRPDLFKSLVIIEPASVSPRMALLLRILPFFIKKTQAPANVAMKKRSIWGSREEFIAHYQKSRAYRRIGPEVMKDLSEYGLTPQEDGSFRLTFSVKWEASNYALAPSIWKYLKQIDIPMTVIGGKPSIFFNQKLRDNWVRDFPKSILKVNTDFGHLFPLEAPELCADLVL